MATNPPEKPRLRRIILPIVLVVGTFFCGYAALFVGVKEDLPAPTASQRYPLSLSAQNLVRDQFGEATKNLKTADVAVYVLRDSPDAAVTFWRNAFVTRRNWKEVDQPPPPRDKGNVNFTTLAFNRSSSKVILAITTGDQLLALNNDFSAALKPAGYRAGDTVAIMIAGDLA